MANLTSRFQEVMGDLYTLQQELQQEERDIASWERELARVWGVAQQGVRRVAASKPVPAPTPPPPPPPPPAAAVQRPAREVALCVYCDCELPPLARFCPGCGQPVPGMAELAPTVVARPHRSRPTCPGCGLVVRPGLRFCHNCGTKLES